VKTIDKFTYLVFNCIEGRLEKVFEEFQQIIDKFDETWIFNRADLNIEQIYFPAPPHGGAQYIEFVLWEPAIQKGSTICMVNSRCGWAHFIRKYSQYYKRPCQHIAFSNQYDDYPAFFFYYHEHGKRQRIIQALKDDPKWVFYQEGEPLPFENLSHYKKRRIRDRLTRDIIIEYSKMLGWDIEDENFWKSNKLAIYGKQLSWD
jgi:hypothetical protein